MLFFSNTPENIFGDNSEESYDIRIKSIKYKSSMEFVKLLKFFILYLEEKGRGFVDITLGNETIISLNDIKELFYNDYVGLHFKRKLEKLKKRILYLIDSNEKRLVEKLAKKLGASCDNLDKKEIIKDIIIIQAYLAKGLEFDIVIIYNARDSKYRDEEDRILLYTACTRALHILDIYYIGNISPLLSNENFYDFVR